MIRSQSTGDTVEIPNPGGSPVETTRITVLLIDGNPADARLIQRAITAVCPELPAQLVQATCLATGLTRLAEGSIDVVLLDLFLSDSQGLDTFTTLHAQAPNIPIVVLTNPDEDAIAVQAGQAGAQDFVCKSHLNGHLPGWILHRAVERHRLLTETTRQLGALHASHRCFYDIIDHHADGIIIVDDQGVVRFINTAAQDLAGLAVGEFLGTVVDFPVVLGEPREVEIMRDGNSVSAEMRLVETTWEGHAAAVVSLHNMTNRKCTEEALREAKEYAENLINSSLDVIVSADMNGRIIAFNKAAETTFGYQRAAVMGKPVDMLYADMEERRRIWECFKKHGSFTGETVNKRHDGSTFVSFLAASMLHDRHGNRTGVMGISRDITHAKKAEQTLRKAHQQTARLLEAIPSILIGLDTHHQVVWWNAAAEAAFGIVPAAVIGRPLETCGLPWDHARIVAGLDSCRQTGKPTSLDDVRFQRTDGKEGLLGMMVNPMQNASDDELCVLLIGADITERKIMQGQLAQAQKLESIGQLAAGIAHEINTPTQYVGDNTRFLHDAFGDLDTLLTHYAALLKAIKNDTVTESFIQEVDTTAAAIDVDYLRQEIPTAIQQSLEGVERVATIVRAMKDFSHPGTEEKTGIDLNKAIQSTLTVARNEWKYVAEMVTDLDLDLPLVACFPAEFNQVILNIIVNAAHALASVVRDGVQVKGTITVSTRQHGNWVEIRIADTGTGIPQAIRNKIFDPFFTTKEVGKGTGQGLAIAHDVVVKKHRGTLTYETQEGQGTTFIIRLPLENLPLATGGSV